MLTPRKSSGKSSGYSRKKYRNFFIIDLNFFIIDRNYSAILQ